MEFGLALSHTCSRLVQTAGLVALQLRRSLADRLASSSAIGGSSTGGSGGSRFSSSSIGGSESELVAAAEVSKSMHR